MYAKDIRSTPTSGRRVRRVSCRLKGNKNPVSLRWSRGLATTYTELDSIGVDADMRRLTESCTHKGDRAAEGIQCPFIAYLQTLDQQGKFVRKVPCVDGSELARDFFTFAVLVGAAMCSAC